VLFRSRHDVDRPLSRHKIRQQLRLHDQLGTRATWYWRARQLESRTLQGRLGVRRRPRALAEVITHPHHEVALHTERLWEEGDADRALLERVIDRPVVGSSAHGAADSFRYQGAPNVLWADTAGLSYTEMIQRAHLHPHRFPALEEDGRIVALDIICLPHHESLDRSMLPGTANTKRLRAMQSVFERAGGLYQVMNHPDLNRTELFELLRAFPRDGRKDVTAAGVADWWRRTHTTDHLHAERVGPNTWKLIAAEPVHALQVELRRPGGTTTTHVVDVLPGHPLVVAGD
jgi:hypothetical protein